jgi:hypothetical protein
VLGSSLDVGLFQFFRPVREHAPDELRVSIESFGFPSPDVPWPGDNLVLDIPEREGTE